MRLPWPSAPQGTYFYSWSTNRRIILNKTKPDYFWVPPDIYTENDDKVSFIPAFAANNSQLINLLSYKGDQQTKRAFLKTPKTFRAQKRFLKFNIFQVAVKFLARKLVQSFSST